MIADAAQSNTLTFAALGVRQKGSTELFRGTNLGAAPGAGVATIKFTTPPAVTFGNVDGSGNLTKASAGTLTVNHARAAALAVNGGTLQLAENGGALLRDPRLPSGRADPGATPSPAPGAPGAVRPPRRGARAH